MPKARPIEVHVNSMGKKKYKFQELIHSRKGYSFVAIDGKQKTELFRKGYLDGRKKPVHLESTYDSCSGTKEVIVFSSSEYATKINRSQLIGVVPLNQTFLISTREADRFIKLSCEECEHYGTRSCYRQGFRCAEDDREKYRDSTWFTLKKDARKERKRLAFP